MTGDSDDIFQRLRNGLPAGWFPQPAPLLDAVLRGVAAVLAPVYALLQYLRQQTRIATASEGNLDLVAADFLGNFRRNVNESDGSYRARILAQIFLQRATRPALHALLLALTGQQPRIVEPGRPADTGAWGVPACGYALAGAWGTLRASPCTVFVTVYRPASIGVPDNPGYGASQGGYGVGTAYIEGDELLSLSDRNLLAAVESVRPAGVVCWVRVVDRG